MPEDLVDSVVLGTTNTHGEQAARKIATRDELEALQEEFLAQLLQDGEPTNNEDIRASIR